MKLSTAVFFMLFAQYSLLNDNDLGDVNGWAKAKLFKLSLMSVFTDLTVSNE